MIIKTSIGKLDTPEEFEPSVGNMLVDDCNSQLRTRHRAIESGPRLEHARSIINDLVEPGADHHHPFQAVHVLNRIDDEPLFRAIARLASLAPLLLVLGARHWSHEEAHNAAACPVRILS